MDTNIGAEQHRWARLSDGGWFRFEDGPEERDAGQELEKATAGTTFHGFRITHVDVSRDTFEKTPNPGIFVQMAMVCWAEPANESGEVVVVVVSVDNGVVADFAGALFDQAACEVSIGIRASVAFFPLFSGQRVSLSPGAHVGSVAAAAGPLIGAGGTTARAGHIVL